MCVPDLALICEVMLMAEGFQKSRELARKFVGLYRLCEGMLSKARHYDWKLRAIKTTLSVAGAMRRASPPGTSEEKVLLRALRDFNVGKLAGGDAPVFAGLLEDLFPGLPATEKPWDLGQMKWAQVPDAWREALEKLEPGQTSGILHGAKGRAWIIKLVDRRVDESVTFESIKGAVVEAMRGSRLEKIREDGERALREAAKIELVKPDAKPAGEE